MIMCTGKKAFNLIETALVLGVVGMLIGGIWLGFNAYQEQRNAKQFVADILMACDKSTNVLRSNLSNGANTFLNNSAVVKLNILPQSWVSGTSTITPPLGTFIPIAPFNESVIWVGSPRGEVRINIFDMTNSECRNVLPLMSKADSTIMRQISIGTGWWTTSSTITLPYTGDTGSLCGASENIHMEFSCTAR